MIETLLPIKIPPGYKRTGTKYDAKGRWYDGNLVRWREGVMQPIGGWRIASNTAGFPLDAIGGSTTVATMARWLSSNGERIVVAVDSKVVANDSTGGGTGAWTDISAAGWATGAVLVPFGGHLIAWSGVGLYTWDGNMANDFTAIAGVAARNVVVTPERFLVALGAGTPYNPRLVQWADQETETVWTPSPTNQAGSLELQTDGEILLGRPLKGQTMILTTTDAWSMTYIGGQFVYSFRKEGDKCGCISKFAAAAVDDRLFWMGRKGFFMYDGFVRPLPCEVADKVFGELSASQKVAQPSSINITAMTVAAMNEVWWFYSTTGNTPNRQVVYNYLTNHWEFHALDRVAGLDAGYGRFPLMIASTNSQVYEHEHPLGQRFGGPSYAESGPFELSSGDRTMLVQRIVPDGSNLADTQLTVYSSFFPVEAETTNGPYSLANPIDVRFKGRQIRLKVNGSIGNDTAADGTWRFGTPRLGVIPSSRR